LPSGGVRVGGLWAAWLETGIDRPVESHSGQIMTDQFVLDFYAAALVATLATCPTVKITRVGARDDRLTATVQRSSAPNWFYRVSVHRRGIDVPMLGKALIVDVAAQVQTISRVIGCERFPRHRAVGVSSPVDCPVGRRQGSR
jgi:hypothetical protein